MCANLFDLDIFVNTKMDEGPCPKIHSEPLKAEFERGSDRYMYDNIIEKEFIARLNEADRVIKVRYFQNTKYLFSVAVYRERG
jgi:hypothetical protein